MRLAAVAALVACRCSSSTPPPPFCGSPMLSGANAVIAVTGEEVSIDVLFSTACDPPTGIDVSVVDLDNEAVPAKGAVAAYVASVTFTPTSPGRHHVTARIQPNRGTVQWDVEIARDRSKEPGLDVPLPNATDVELSDAGFLVANNVAYELSPFRPVHGFTGTVLVTDDVVWTNAAAAVSRFAPTALSDAGLGFERATPLLTQFGEPFFPTRDDVVALRDNQVNYARLEGNQLTSRPVPASGVIWQHRLGNSVVGWSTDRTCALDVLDGGLRCVVSAPVNGRYVGGDTTSIWLERDGVLIHHDGTSANELLLPEVVEILGSSAPRFRVGPREYIAVSANGTMGFEYWGSLASASATTVATHIDGGVRVRRR